MQQETAIAASLVRRSLVACGLWTCVSMACITCTLPETNIGPENRPSQKESSLPMSSNLPFSGAMLVSGSVYINLHVNIHLPIYYIDISNNCANVRIHLITSTYNQYSGCSNSFKYLDAKGTTGPPNIVLQHFEFVEKDNSKNILPTRNLTFE